MRIFNLIDGVWGHKRDVGFVGVKCADNLPYENRNGTGLLSFSHINNFKNFLKFITCHRQFYNSCFFVNSY